MPEELLRNGRGNAEEILKMSVNPYETASRESSNDPIEG